MQSPNGVRNMGNRLVLDLKTLTINADLDRIYYAKVPFVLGNYLVGLLWEAGVPSTEWQQRVAADLHTFNREQLGGAVYRYVIDGTAKACVENHLAGNGNLFAKIRREGLTSITQSLTAYPKSKGRGLRGPRGRMAA